MPSMNAYSVFLHAVLLVIGASGCLTPTDDDKAYLEFDSGVLNCGIAFNSGSQLCRNVMVTWFKDDRQISEGSSLELNVSSEGLFSCRIGQARVSDTRKVLCKCCVVKVQPDVTIVQLLY